jgi:hypothetical protein
MVKRVNGSTEVVDANEDRVVTRYQVARFTFEEVSDVYGITLWILLGSLAKIGKLFQFYFNNHSAVYYDYFYFRLSFIS